MQGCQPFSSRLLPSVNIGCRLPVQTHSVCVILMPAAWSGLLDYANVYAPCMTSPKVDSLQVHSHSHLPSCCMAKASQCGVMLGIAAQLQPSLWSLINLMP